MFKNIITIMLSLGAIVFTAYSFYAQSISVCDKGLEYSIGRFDTQFGISEEQFKSEIVKAESVWEKAIGKEVFVYKPNAQFKINLIYDERQLSTTQKQKTESGLEAAGAVLKNLDTDFTKLKAKHDLATAYYKARQADFESRQEIYNDKVTYWNDRGGAPKNEYESLQREAAFLKTEMEKLNTEVVALNQQTKELNSILERRNKAASAYNKIADTYNDKYGHGLEFNQAEYTGKNINVYQFTNSKDLSVALSHEFGHALGMGHVEDSSSIMYYLTGGNSSISLVPSSNDMEELGKVCK